MVNLFILVLVSVLGLTACKPASTKQESSSSPQSTNARTFQVKGVVVSVTPKEKSVEIKHETIPGFMPAMTMPFDVKDVKELAGLKQGDSVSFRMLVTDTEGWIDQIQKIAPLATNSPVPATPIRLREVEPLNLGDLLPEYQFTNQFGESISTSQYRGKALAITFLFTRCPFPTFCPLMANHFAEAQQKLAAKTDAPTNWHLLTISFDPEFDTPAVLKAYGERYKYDPVHSTFATGAMTEISPLAEQAGLNFSRDASGSINHNLRTLVIGADGKLRKIFVGNDWKSDDLVEELIQAAK
jgi:protein SCO1